MLSHTLPKATGNGFTVVPNRVIDAIISSQEKHTSDSLALALYLVRHIPSQSGTLALAGDFSQTAICEDLGWGPTNRARLKRALSDLENAGVVTSELRDNNTPILHVTAELRDGRSSMAAAGEGGAKDSLQGAAKISTPPPCQDFSRASRPPASSSSSSANKNSNLNNLHHHPELLRNNSASAREVEQDDDDVKRLLDLYRSELKKTFSPRAAQNFAETYALHGNPFALVETAIRAIAKHPMLLRDTTSPNAVWELDYMKKKAAAFDAHIYGYLDSASRSDATDFAKELQALANGNNCDAATLAAYYRSHVDSLIAEKARWQSADTLSGQDGALQPSDDSHQPDVSDPIMAPTATPPSHESPDQTATEPSPLGNISSQPSSSTAHLNNAATTVTPNEQASPDGSPAQSAERGGVLIVAPQASPTQDERKEADTAPNRESNASSPRKTRECHSAPTDAADSLTARLNAFRSHSIPGTSPPQDAQQIPQPQEPFYPPDLLMAKTKNELALLVAKHLAIETCPDRQRRLKILADFVAVDRMSFAELRKIVQRRSGPPMSAAA